MFGAYGFCVQKYVCYISDAVKQLLVKIHVDGLFQPKTVHAFQRVKVDEVEFVDERLKDNSYWAKVR